MDGEAALIWCPFPDMDSARQVADALIGERLIACANLLPGVHSLFLWQGERCGIEECGMLCKTAAPRLAAAMARLGELHPYDTPALVGWAVLADPGTLTWLEDATEKR